VPARLSRWVLALLVGGAGLLGLAGVAAVGGYLVAVWLRGPDRELAPSVPDLAPLEIVVDPALDPTGAWHPGRQPALRPPGHAIEVLCEPVDDDGLRIVRLRHKDSGYVDHHEILLRYGPGGEVRAWGGFRTYASSDPSSAWPGRDLRGVLRLSSARRDLPEGALVIEYEMEGEQGGSPESPRGKIVL
jgi:hypothetical protein